MYHYFFSGAIVPNPYSPSYFNAEISLQNEISSYEDISLLRNKFAEKENINPEKVIILNYQLLRVDE